MKTTVKQSPALARTGALTLAILLGFSAAALPAQAQTAGKSKTAATKKAPQASSRSGDYIVAIVNSEPVTNHEVNRRASMLAQQLAANKVAVPDRATLLRRALNDEILQKAATFSARNSGMTVGDEVPRDGATDVPQPDDAHGGHRDRSGQRSVERVLRDMRAILADHRTTVPPPGPDGRRPRLTTSPGTVEISRVGPMTALRAPEPAATVPRWPRPSSSRVQVRVSARGPRSSSPLEVTG